MKRILLVITSLALFIASAMGMVGPTQAHSSTIDGTTTEWTTFGSGLGDENTGHIIRSALGQGEFAWRDEAKDQRIVDTTTIYTREVDLRQVRVTGDATTLSMYVLLGGTTNIGPGTNLVQLQVALDTDLVANSGQTQLAAPATANPTVTAPWERLLQTQFSSVTPAAGANISIAPLKVYSAAAPTTASTPTGATSAISKADNTIELSVPWSALGFSGPPTTPVRFTVVSLRDNGAIPPDGGATNILDTLSPSTSVTGLANTQNELADGKIDYTFQVNFAPSGEVYSPLLITEVSLKPTTTSSTSGDPTMQWFELTNVSGTAISGSVLKNYKVGDASGRGSSESMFSLTPLSAVNLAANQSLIFTRNRAKFKTAYNFDNTQIKSVYTLTTTNSLAAYSSWAGTDFALPTQGANPLYDQVVLLDSQDTIADLVEYATDTSATQLFYPDHNPALVPSMVVGAGPAITVSPDVDLQRCPAERDTNNRDVSSPDFIVTTLKAQQTPLTTCAFSDVYVTISGPQIAQVQVKVATTQNYTIAYGNKRQPANGVLITDTLPLGMTYVAGSTQSTPSVGEPTTSTDGGGRTRLVWTVGAVASGAIGSITIATSVAAGTTAPASSSHDVRVTANQATPELSSELTNNSASLAVSYTTEPVVNLSVTKTLNTSKSQVYSGGKLVYTITYANTGNKAANDVTLLDTIPAGLSYLSNSRNFTTSTPANGQVQFNATPLASGASDSFDVTFSISENLTQGSVVTKNQVAVASSTTPEIDSNNNTASSQEATLGARPPTADLVVSKRVQDASNATAGGTIVYAIDYSNTGQLNASSVTLTDKFPDSLEYVSNSARLVPNQSVAGQVTFSVVPLVPGDRASFQITFKVKSSVAGGTSVQNNVTIATTSAEAPTSNNTATSETTIIRGTTATNPTANHIIYLPIVKRAQ